jgi:hypothetical protein
MKRLLAVFVFAASFAGAQQLHISTYVQRYNVDLLRDIGLPIPSSAANQLVVFSTGLAAGASYTVTLAYQYGAKPQIVNTVQVVADPNGVIRASFPVQMLTSITPSLVGWSISDSQ